MKKGKTLIITILFLQLILITSSIPASHLTLAKSEIETSSSTSIDIIQQFSIPEIKKNNEFINIHLDEATSVISISGKPVLPVYSQTLEFPLGTHVKKIQCICSDVKELQLSKKIIPASKPVTWHQKEEIVQIEMDNDIYTADQLYPESWYSFKLTGGLNRDNKETTFLSIQLNPVRYNPTKDIIQFVRSIKLEITYEEPKNAFVSADEYDLLIISYDRYAPLLKRLVTHKNNYGVKTKLVTLQDIYKGNYFEVQGRDNPEKIKYFIKDAKENWGITYVMLVGNFKKIPIRYAHLETDPGGIYEELKFPCDLYYADIYDSEGNFSSWDTDNDGIYGEWSSSMEDNVDLAPDVYLGRLACMFSFEVRTIVNKIIDYETNTYGSEWFNTMIVCGGDTFDKSWEGGTDYNEGEEANEKALEYMTGFDPVRLYASLGNLQTATIHDEISDGAGFLYFVGHGSPKNWATHSNGDYTNWTEGFTNKDMMKLSHKGMYPILMVGGCHNSQFDVTPMNIIKGLLEEGFHYFSSDPNDFGSYCTSNWVPECWSWVFVKKRDGGAIASMGSTGYGGVNIGDSNGNDIPDCVEGLDGWFETQFFRLYNEENIDVLGETYSQTVTDYVNSFPVYSDRYDCKIVETHVLFGDPSLKIGGYQ